MIRTAALLCLVTLPVQAQDFRGLMPGMPPSELAGLGEPLSFMPLWDGDPLTEAVYPLPYGQRLQVYFNADEILSLTTWGDPVEQTLGDAPDTGGLQTFTSTMGDAIDLAGSEGGYFEARGQLEAGTRERTWWLVYEVPAVPGALLELQFLELNASDPVASVDGVVVLPRDVPLAQAALYSPAYLAEFAGIYGDTVTARPGAAPFAAALTEAFPLTLLP